MFVFFGDLFESALALVEIRIQVTFLSLDKGLLTHALYRHEVFTLLSRAQRSFLTNQDAFVEVVLLRPFAVSWC